MSRLILGPGARRKRARACGRLPPVSRLRQDRAPRSADRVLGGLPAGTESSPRGRAAGKPGPGTARVARSRTHEACDDSERITRDAGATVRTIGLTALVVLL